MANLIHAIGLAAAILGDVATVFGILAKVVVV